MFDEDLEIEGIDESVIEQRLKSLNCPVGDEYFADSQKLPYVVYHTPSASYFGADSDVMMRKQVFRVELYTLSKADKRRKKLFSLFSDVDFDAEEESGGQRNYYYVGITFTQILPADFGEDE